MKTKPQEKAKDLVSKFGHDLALKVVTEITIAMETYDDRNDTFELQNMEGDFRYWDQVNIELQHLRQQQDEKQSPSAVELLVLKLGKEWVLEERDLYLIGQAKENEKQEHKETWDTAHQAGRFEGKGIAEENWQTFEEYWDEKFKRQ